MREVYTTSSLGRVNAGQALSFSRRPRPRAHVSAVEANVVTTTTAIAKAVGTNIDTMSYPCEKKIQ